MDFEAPAQGSRVFKAIFAMTVPLGVGWLLGFILEPLLEITLPHILGITEHSVSVFVGLLALLYLIAFAAIWPGRGIGRAWMWLPRSVPAGRALLSTALGAVGGYVIAIPFCFLIALLLTRGSMRGEAGTAVMLFAFWMPLWWAVPIGTIIAWRVERQSQRSAKQAG